MRPAIALALMLAVIGPACGDDDNPIEPDPVGAVSGTVTRIETGLPASGVGVVLVGVTTMLPLPGGTVTDSLGQYALSGITPGEYAVFLSSDSLIVFDRTAPTVQITGNATTTHDIRLLRSALWDGSGYRIEGTIVDAVSGEPVADAFVTSSSWALSAEDVVRPFEGIAHSSLAISDEQGGFSITSIVITEMDEPVGLWPLAVSRSGYEPQALVGDGTVLPGLFGPPLPLPAGTDSVLTVQVSLTPLSGGATTDAGALRGLVRDPARQPVAGLQVALSLVVTADPDTVRSGGPEPAPVQGRVATTAADGSFLIADLVPGDYVVTAAYPANDGYLHHVPSGGDPVAVTVAAADTADAGELRVVPAIAPLSPVAGGSVTSATPELSWPAVAGASEYRLEIGAGHILELLVDELSEPRWQVPAEQAFADGDHLRWMVTARGEVLGVMTTLACFETVAAFTVDLP